MAIVPLSRHHPPSYDTKEHPPSLRSKFSYLPCSACARVRDIFRLKHPLQSVALVLVTQEGPFSNMIHLDSGPL